MGFLIGVLLLIAFVVIVLFYGIPYLSNSAGGGAGTGAAPQVQVPGEVDVNVKQQP